MDGFPSLPPVQRLDCDLDARATGKALVAAALTLLLGMVVVSQASSDVGRAPCVGGTEKTVEVGILKAIGCWTEATKDGATIYTGRWSDQGGEGIDLNGFIMNGPKGGGLQINAKTRQVSTVSVEGEYHDKAQLYAKGFPSAGLHELGKEIRFDFAVPEKGSLQLEDLHLGSNTTYAALAGLTPVGDVDTPIKIEEGGRGSMDLSVLLAGYFTLKGKPQSVTIALPTESGKGTDLDVNRLWLRPHSPAARTALRHGDPLQGHDQRPAGRRKRDRRERGRRGRIAGRRSTTRSAPRPDRESRQPPGRGGLTWAGGPPPRVA